MHHETRRSFFKKIVAGTTLSTLSSLPVISKPDMSKKLRSVSDIKSSEASNQWVFSKDFSSQQGENNWYYYEWNGKKYTPLKWDENKKIWQGNGKLCRVDKKWISPDKSDSVIAWKAPRNGRVSIKGHVRRNQKYKDGQDNDRQRIEYRGDGVRFKIKQNSKQVWPSNGWQEIEVRSYLGSYQYPQKEYTLGGCSAQHILLADVKAGDVVYFHLNQFGNPDYDQVEWNPEITYDDTPWFLTDKMEIVMYPEDLERVGFHTFDGSFGTLPDNKGGAYWWHSEWNGTLHFKLHGPLENPSKELVFVKKEEDFWEDFRETLPAGNAWIQNFFYDKERGNVIAFIHYEHVPPDNFKIGLAVSKNNGDTFRLLGYMLESEADLPLNQSDSNMLGCPYFIKDEYFYLYYADHGMMDGAYKRRPAVARAKVKDVLEAANVHKMVPWYKFYNGKWEEPGLGGKATQIFDPYMSLHGDAVYNKETDTYLLSGFSEGGRDHNGVFLSRSKDGISWEHSWLMDNGKVDPLLCPYITIVNVDGTDNSEVGKEFYVYWTFNSQWGPDDQTPLLNYGLQTLYRQKVILT